MPENNARTIGREAPETLQVEFPCDLVDDVVGSTLFGLDVDLAGLDTDLVGGAVIGLCPLDHIGDVELLVAKFNVDLGRQRRRPRRAAGLAAFFFGSAAGASATASTGAASFFSDMTSTFFHKRIQKWEQRK